MTDRSPLSRRQFLTAVGMVGGAPAMFRAMEALGQLPASDFRAPPQLQGTPRARNVIVLGAGLAGMTAAYELRKAGYKVQILEYQDRSGGRCWTLRGGDRFTELGGATQEVRLAPGNYFNPGPWRIPSSHRAVLHYCREFAVALEPFIAANGEAFLHSRTAFGGKPRRYREVANDFMGHISELLAKATHAGKLDEWISKEDRERLLEAVKGWGRLDEQLAYRSGLRTASRRGFERWPGAGPDGAPTPSPVSDLEDVLNPFFWRVMDFNSEAEMFPTVLQPVGGMDSIAKAFTARVKESLTLGAKVTKIEQNERGVTVQYEDGRGAARQAQADWCICTLPLQAVSQLEAQFSPALLAAIHAVPYAPHVKVGLEFRRRFWEEDDGIYGGSSFTDQPISMIAYPNDRFHSRGPAVLLGAYPLDISGFDFGGMSPEERIEAAIQQGELIHPQYRREFRSGVSVAWSRVPWILGCRAIWSQETRERYYRTLIEPDGRVILAGEHCSHVHGWQEGAITSALYAITRVHEKAMGASS